MEILDYKIVDLSSCSFDSVICDHGDNILLAEITYRTGFWFFSKISTEIAYKSFSIKEDKLIFDSEKYTFLTSGKVVNADLYAFEQSKLSHLLRNYEEVDPVLSNYKYIKSLGSGQGIKHLAEVDLTYGLPSCRTTEKVKIYRKRGDVYRYASNDQPVDLTDVVDEDRIYLYENKVYTRMKKKTWKNRSGDVF